MSAHLEKVLRHAERRLMNHALTRPTDMLDLYRDFLKVEDHRLRLDHKAGATGMELCARRADLFTVVLRHAFGGAFENAKRAHGWTAEECPLALLAVGGFGRGLLSPGSDIDLMFLHGKLRKGTLEERFVRDVVEQVLYTLWDVGLKVGHSSRDLEEVIRQGREDFQNATAMLESRLLSGSEALFGELQRRYFRLVFEGGRQRAYLEWRFRDQEVRHEKNGGTVFVQEPNVKNGCGGLRDLHHLRWVARVAQGLQMWEDLRKEGWLSARECKEVETAQDFLLRVRNELHLQSGRASDVLTLRAQGQAANAFGYAQRTLLRRTEALMRDYYGHARNLYQVCNLAARRMVGRTEEKAGVLAALVPKRLRREVNLQGFVVRDRELHSPDEAFLSKDLLHLVQAFALMQKHGVALSAELKLQIRSRAHLLTRTALRRTEFGELLFQILRQKGRVGGTLRAMHEAGVLGRLVPEFAPLDCLVQHEFFHRYTADEHTLVCLEELDGVMDHPGDATPGYRRLLEECGQPEIVYLALLLHDTGKASNARNHAEASAQLAVRFARRMRISGRSRQLLTFLVDHHATMTVTATRKNLDDPLTVRDFARLVGDREQLQYLILMSYADGRGTSDQSWNSWKEALVWRLYRRADEMLADEAEFVRKAECAREEAQARVEALVPEGIGPEDVGAHLRMLPPAYLHYRNEKLIALHLDLVHRFIWQQLRESDPRRALRPVVHWEDHPERGHTAVTLVTWDREALFSKISGAFTVAGLTILSADIWTRQDNIVIDTFRVATEVLEAVTAARDRTRFEEVLEASLNDPAFDLDALIPRRAEPVRVLPGAEEWVHPTLGFDTEGSAEHSLLHVRAPDRRGLLYLVSHALADHGLVIRNARISTEKGMALDTFYLQTPDSRPLEGREERIALLRDLNNRLEEFLQP